MGKVIAIVGRPNVGKSTLFNRLIGERQAIIDDVSGVTRDRQYGTCIWNGKTFLVVDTGGFVEHSEDPFEKAIRAQVHIAVQEAEIILFMADVTTGITDLDAEMAQVLRKSKKPVFLLVNKVDNHERLMLANEFWALGFDNTFFLSSITGSGTGEVLDEVVAKLPDEPEEDPTALPRFAVVGQPNVGKSSFINALMDEDRNIVTDIAGTTRDAIHTRYTKFGKDFILVDTAGLRRKARVHENLEFYSVMRTLKALEECDVCMLLIDAQTGVEAQDMAIFRLAQRRHKGIVLLINKWDLVEKETNTARDMEKEIKLKISPFSDVPVLFMSAMDKTRIFKAMELALEVNENRQRRIKTSELNDTMLEIIERNPAPAYRGNYIKIKYVTQLPLAYPAFVFFANHPKEIKEAYRLFLENKLREHFQFTGAPMALMFRQK
ncbi:MAG: ribosome biogenesis GTPase Der [Saprospiraceae bacterium]|nr:ribosome biogenesis GTPase Der [Saprospiraceae bacterium]